MFSQRYHHFRLKELKCILLLFAVTTNHDMDADKVNRVNAILEWNDAPDCNAFL